MRSAHMRGALLLVALVTVAIALPGAGQTKPPQEDGSTYSWFGASVLTVDVKPWGGGYVRSDPYLIDCPLACIRPFERDREITLTAFATPGHRFESWEGPCAGQGNPCKVKASGVMEVTAVYSGQFLPPAPPPAAVNPSVTAVVSGVCPDCSIAVAGTGFNPNSPISIAIDFSTPPFNQEFPNARTSDASGSWSASFAETCEFGAGAYVGPIEEDITATDAQGASATVHVSTECPASEPPVESPTEESEPTDEPAEEPTEEPTGESPPE